MSASVIQSKNLYRTIVHSQKNFIRSLLTKTANKQNVYDNIFNVGKTSNKEELCEPFDHVPGPTGIYKVPYIGFVSHFQPFGQYTSGSFHKFLQHLHNQFGDIVKHRFGRKWMVFLFNPDDIRNCLWQDEKYPYRAESAIMMTYARRENKSSGLAFQNGKEWEESRRTVQGQLCPKSIVKYSSQLLDIADGVLCLYPAQQCIPDVQDVLIKYTMSCSVMLCFGNKMQNFSFGGEEEETVKAILKFLDAFNKSYDCIPSYIFRRTSLYKQFKDSYSFIKDNVERFLQSCQSDDNLQTSLICHMLQNSQMTQDKISSIITDLFITAVDSTANVLSFVIYHLAQNRACQDKIFEEICNSEADTTKPFQNLPYLKSCVKESMRLVSPLRDGARRTLDKDTVVSGFLIPKGNVLVFCNNTICTSEKYFPDPYKYVPERWMRADKQRQYIHPYASLPFGHGRRNCVGQRFAEQVMYAFILKLVKNYSFSLSIPHDKVGCTYKLFSTPDKIFSVHLKPRS